MNVTVLPLARAMFVQPVTLGTTILDASVELTWRGRLDEVAIDSGSISEEHPVFVHIEPTDSPNPNLANMGGVGLVYDIRAVGCYQQTGEEGFISAKVTLPVLTEDLDRWDYGTLHPKDLVAKCYDKWEKRFIRVNESYHIPFGNVKWVIGNISQGGIITAFLDFYLQEREMNPDLVVYSIAFSRSPVIKGQEVEVRISIGNIGKTTVRNVDVKIYDGNDLIGDQRIDELEASGGSVTITETYTVTMIHDDRSFENHYIKAFVNKQHAINEGSSNYKNNEKSELLVVVMNQGSACWSPYEAEPDHTDVPLDHYGLIAIASVSAFLFLYVMFDPWERLAKRRHLKNFSMIRKRMKRRL
jgi:hypothetical protein